MLDWLSDLRNLGGLPDLLDMDYENPLFVRLRPGKKIPSVVPGIHSNLGGIV
ncbi:MAG: hypothetical protein ACI845_003775, partial [Gammaproteobacteria bacterium]